MKGYRKILIAVNGSTDVLKKGIKLAQDEGCWVTVIKVIPSYEGELNLTGIRNIQDVLNSSVAQDMENIKAIASSEGALIKTRIETGNIYKKILEVAEEERCDLIIVGKTKRRGIIKFFGDNVVEKIIHNSPCPVLVVKG